MKNKNDKQFIAKSVSVLSKCNSVEDAASELGVSSRHLRRLFSDAGMLQPAAYLPYTNIDLTKNQKARIRQLYSEFGGSFTKGEIAAELRVPLEKVDEYIKQSKITHDILPLSESDEKNLLDSDKIKKALEVRDYKLKARLEQLEVQKIKESASKWESFTESFTKPLFSVLEKLVPRYEPKKLELEEVKPYAAVLSIQDFHFGRLASKLDTKEDTDTLKQENDLLNCIQDLMSKVAPFGTPEILYLTIGGDFFNSDNSKQTTTHGTPQDSFPSHAATTVKGSLLIIKAIDLLRQFFPYIELVFTGGNHDGDSSVSLYLFASAWFRDCEDVFTFFDMQQPNVRKRQYRQYGNNLIAFAHGDGLKIKSVPTIIANEAREIWGQTKHVLVITGHHHFRISQDLFGMQHVQVPTLASEDRWGEGKGYINEKGMSIVLLDKEKGLFAEIISHI